MPRSKSNKEKAAVLATAALMLPATLPAAAEAMQPASAGAVPPAHIVISDEIADVYGPAEPNAAVPEDPDPDPGSFAAVYGPAEPDEPDAADVATDGTILSLFFGDDEPTLHETEVSVPSWKTIGMWAGIIIGVIGIGAVAGVLIGKKAKNGVPKDLPASGKGGSKD